MEDLKVITLLASDIEKLGIVGILSLLLLFFIWLYIKQIKENAKELREISEKIKILLETYEKQTNRFFDLIIERESNFREERKDK